jgi:hypothetical protein
MAQPNATISVHKAFDHVAIIDLGGKLTGSTRFQRLAEVSGQCPKKLRTGFRHRALDKKTQDLVLSNPWFGGVLQHDRHKGNLRL